MRVRQAGGEVHKSSFIRKQGTTCLPEDFLMNEPLSLLSVCVRVCVCASVLRVYFCQWSFLGFWVQLYILTRLHMCEASSCWDAELIPEINLFSISLSLANYLLHTHTHTWTHCKLTLYLNSTLLFLDGYPALYGMVSFRYKHRVRDIQVGSGIRVHKRQHCLFSEL